MILRELTPADNYSKYKTSAIQTIGKWLSFIVHNRTATNSTTTAPIHLFSISLGQHTHYLDNN